jgi:hypothetical protein
MEGVRMQFNGSGEQVDTNFEKAGSEQAKAPSSPYRTGHEAIRVTVTEDGATTLSRSSATGVKAPSGPSVTEATAVNEHGQRARLDEASAKTVLNLGPALGDATAEVWERLGYVRKLSTGGYELTSQPQSFSKPAAPQPAQQQQQPAPPPASPVEPVDLSGVKGTSDDAESTLRLMQENASVHLESLIHQAATGKQIDYRAVAAEIGDQDGGRSLENMVAEHRDAGVAVLRSVDSTISPVAFEAYIQQKPDLANKIIRAALRKDLGPLAEAARAYAEERTNDIETRINDAGVKTTRHGKTLLISRADLGIAMGRGDFASSPWITLAEALRTQAIDLHE